MLSRAVMMALLLAAVPLAGCIAKEGAGTDPDDAAPGSRATDRNHSGHPGVDLGERPEGPCPHLDVVVDKPQGFIPGENVGIRAMLVNCSKATIRPSIPSCVIPDRLEVTIPIGDKTWHLGGGPAQPEALDGGCDVFPRDIPAGDSFEVALHWDGRLATSGCDAMRCADDAWAPPGTYDVDIALTSEAGERWTATGRASFLPPELPPYSNDWKVVFLVEDNYTGGAAMDVRVKNIGTRTLVYSLYYPACTNVQFHNATGYPFMVPEGTHCDLVNRATLAPGNTTTLFQWGLDECVVDLWGCAQSRALPPGTYHIAGTFHEDVPRYWEKPHAATHAGATFRIVEGP